MRPVSYFQQLLLLGRGKQQSQLFLLQIKYAFRTSHRFHQSPNGLTSYSFYII